MIGPQVEDVVVRGRAANAGAPSPPQDFSRLLGRLAPGEDPAVVEARMRSELGALEDIEPLYFAREVKRAVARIHASHPASALAS